MSGVVVDTNILVRAVLSGKRSEDNVLKKAVSEGFGLVCGRRQIKELVEVLAYERIAKKYMVDREEVGMFVKWLTKKSREVEAEKIELCRDADDNYIVGLAVRAAKRRRVYLVTGDKDILDLKGRIERVEIVTPGEFLE